MYTTAAHYATHIYLMARTDPDAPRHRGISIFLIPMDTPGITVRPLWTIQNNPPAPLGTTYGDARTNETFFEKRSGASFVPVGRGKPGLVRRRNGTQSRPRRRILVT